MLAFNEQVDSSKHFTSFPLTRVGDLKSCHFPLVNWLLNSSNLWEVVVVMGQNLYQVKIGFRISEIWLSFSLLCRTKNEPTLNLSNGIALVISYQHYVR